MLLLLFILSLLVLLKLCWWWCQDGAVCVITVDSTVVDDVVHVDTVAVVVHHVADAGVDFKLFVLFLLQLYAMMLL